MKAKNLKFLGLCFLLGVMLFAISCNKKGSDGDSVQESVAQSVEQSKSESESTHTHNYSVVTGTAEGHWSECACGAKSEIEAHVGGEATCESKATCSICNLTYGTVGLHNFVDETCTFCNRKASQGLEYELSEDGTYYILVGVGSCADTEILMPSLYNGLPVKEIGPSAFSLLGVITKIEIGDNVTAIRNSAFNKPNHFGLPASENVLQELVISKSVTVIESQQSSGGREFLKVKYKGDVADWCNIQMEDLSANFFQSYEEQEVYINGEIVKEVVIPNTVTEIKPFTFALSKITRLTVSENTTKIGASAFSNCAYLIEVDLGGVQSIGEHAFAYTSMVKVTVGSNLTEIGSEAFVNTQKMVEVINNSPHFTFEAGSSEHGCIAEYALSVSNCDSSYKSKISSEDGYIIYNGDTLLGYDGEDVNFVIPDGIVSIYRLALMVNYSIESITIPQSVVEVGNHAFQMLPISDVYYKGSLEDWLKISFTGYYANPLSSGANLYIGNELVSELIIPESVDTILGYAFAGCASLTSVTIHAGVHTIGSSAFDRCENLSSITICGEDTIVKSRAFNQTAFYNDRNNWSFACLYLGNILLERHDSNLVTCKIKSGTTQIVEQAFTTIHGMTKLVIPNSVQTIASKAFPTIGTLKNVYYEGTYEEWQALTAHIASDNLLLKATVYFYVENEADVPTDGGNYWHYDDSGNPVAW